MGFLKHPNCVVLVLGLALTGSWVFGKVETKDILLALVSGYVGFIQQDSGGKKDADKYENETPSS
jgi:hypothetical protein